MCIGFPRVAIDSRFSCHVLMICHVISMVHSVFVKITKKLRFNEVPSSPAIRVMCMPAIRKKKQENKRTKPVNVDASQVLSVGSRVSYQPYSENISFHLFSSHSIRVNHPSRDADIACVIENIGQKKNCNSRYSSDVRYRCRVQFQVYR